MKLYELNLPLPLTKIEDRPDTETASRALEKWCSDFKNRVPGPATSYEKETKLSYLANNYSFRATRLNEQLEHLDLLEFFIEPAIVKKHNISPDTVRCNHDDCKNSRNYEIKKDGKTNNVYFCKHDMGIFPEYLETCPNELKNATAQLLRTPSAKTYWFREDIALAEKQALKEGWNSFLSSSPEVKVAELGAIFTKDADKTRERFPDYVGKTLAKEVPVTELQGSTGNSRAYAFYWKGLRIVGGKFTSGLYPGLLNGIIRDAILVRLGKKQAKPSEPLLESYDLKEGMLEYILSADKRLRNADEQEFVIEHFLEDDWRKKVPTTEEVKLKKELGRRYQELIRTGKMEKSEGGMWLSAIVTKNGLRLLEECTAEDWKELDRGYYWNHFLKRPLNRISGINPDTLVSFPESKSVYQRPEKLHQLDRFQMKLLP